MRKASSTNQARRGRRLARKMNGRKEQMEENKMVHKNVNPNQVI
jgi:hypothetical protein